MSIRIRRITLILLAGALLTALVTGCQGQSTPAAAPTTPVENPPAPAATIAYPGVGGQPAAVTTPVVDMGYPAVGELAPTPQLSTPAVAGYPGPAGVPALPNQANVVAQFIEQRAGPNDSQIILRVKLLSAAPVPGSTDFISQLVNQEMDLVASAAGLPQLAKNDQFEAMVSLNGDENNRQYSASQIKKK